MSNDNHTGSPQAGGPTTGNRPGDDAGSRSGSDAGKAREFHEAVDRLEQAVQDMVGSASGQFADRAAAFIDQTTEQLRREFGRSGRSDGETDRSQGESTAGNHVHIYGLQIGGRGAAEDERPPRPDTGRQRSGYLYRDTSRQRIVGVCAGIAAYYGVEPWIVRIIAVTGLLFLPSIVFPAYWVAYFVLDKGPEAGRGRSRRRHHGSRGHRREAQMNRSSHAPGGADGGDRSADRQSPLTPRGSLRNLSADLTEAELRLRRMESHVTSGQYELQRELAKIDDGHPAGGHGGGSAAAPSG